MSENDPTVIGCPSCAGCVRVVEGPHHHRQFVCSVGHTFALWELYEAKETELERTQWSSTALLKHLQIILAMLLEAPGIPDAPDSSTIRQRLDEISRQIASVQQMIEHTSWLTRQGARSLEHETGQVQ